MKCFCVTSMKWWSVNIALVCQWWFCLKMEASVFHGHISSSRLLFLFDLRIFRFSCLFCAWYATVRYCFMLATYISNYNFALYFFICDLTDNACLSTYQDIRGCKRLWLCGELRLARSHLQYRSQNQLNICSWKSKHISCSKFSY